MRKNLRNVREYFGTSKQQNQIFFRSLLYEKFRNHFNPNYILEKKMNFIDLNEDNLQLVKSNFWRVPKERRKPKKRIRRTNEQRVKTQRDQIQKTSLTLTKEKEDSPKRYSTQNENTFNKLKKGMKKNKSVGINSCMNFSSVKMHRKESAKRNMVLPTIHKTVSQYLSSRELYSVSQSKPSLNPPFSVNSRMPSEMMTEVMNFSRQDQKPFLIDPKNMGKLSRAQSSSSSKRSRDSR